MNLSPLAPLLGCGPVFLPGDDPVAKAKADAMWEAIARARTPTVESIVFQVVVLLGVAVACAVMYRRVKNFGYKFLATAAGVMVFEYFTAPMWRNEKLGFWGYVYHDVSWILTLGWAALIMGSSTLVDHLMPRRSEPVRFLVSLLLLLVLVLIAENAVVALGIRFYAPEVQAVLSGYEIGVVPVEALYYVPVFTALVLAFSRYWGHFLDDPSVVPTRRTHWLRALGLTFLAVVLFEMMIEPMVQNRNFPEWSYYYRDLSILLTGSWIVIIAAAAVVVERYLSHRPVPQRFAAALLLITALALPLESWLIHSGHRVYGPSATANFSGFKTWLTGVPVEIVFAIPLYMALVIGFIRYWEVVSDRDERLTAAEGNHPRGDKR